MIKRIFIGIFLFVFVFALSLPCFAVGFGELAPNVTNYAYMPLTDGQITSGDLDLYKEMVDLQTKLGFYAGAEPVAILAYRLGGTQMQVHVYVVPPVIGYGEKKYSYNCDVVNGVLACSSRNSNNETDNDRNTQLIRFTMCVNGSFGASTSSTFLKTVTLDSENYYMPSVMWLKNYDGEWYRPSVGSAPVSVSENVSESLQNIVNDLKTAVSGDGGTPLPVDDGNYFLDIPSIITSLPLAASAILTNAFSFELFGINIAGFLSVILVLTIIGWLVWLLIFKK